MTAGADVAPVTITVLAKAPVAGRVKTRLCPPFTPTQAARLAAAALEDTLAAVLATAGTAPPVLALDGDPARCPGIAMEIVPQRGDGLAERIGNAVSDAHAARGGPVLVVGMDTPQISPADLSAAAAAFDAGCDAVLGPAADGGFWLLGLRQPDMSLLAGVPMSTARTGAVQLERLRSAGLDVHVLDTLTDVDDAASARSVAARAPHTRFAALLRAIVPEESP